MLEFGWEGMKYMLFFLVSLWVFLDGGWVEVPGNWHGGWLACGGRLILRLDMRMRAGLMQLTLGCGESSGSQIQVNWPGSII